MKRFKQWLLLAAVLCISGPALAAGGMSSDMNSGEMSWFGGPVYNGAPALEVTAALVKAGGGAHFSFQKALVSMLGAQTVNAEVGKLSKQYGKRRVGEWIHAMDFYVPDALKRATAAGVKLPAAPADLSGQKLAETLVTAGTTDDGTFWAGWLFDHALSHNIHLLVMADLEAKHGRAYDENAHRLTNQAMYDVAQALGKKDVKLASLH